MKKEILLNCLLLIIVFAGTEFVRPAHADDLSVDSGYIPVEGGSIYYEASGTGPAIIMIHDGILHRETWDAQFEAFAEDHRVVRWDRRGYGKSPSPKAPFSNLEDLLALMNALSVEKATLMGCSSGGLLALDFTLDYPERVSSLVLVGPIISGFDFSAHFNSRGGRYRLTADSTVEERIEYWVRKDQWSTAPESRAAKDKLEKLLTANPQNMTGSGRYAKGPGRQALGRLHEIKVATLIIAGESDIPDVHTHIGVIQSRIAGSRRIILNNSGHLAHFEAPYAFNKVVSDFLEMIE